MGPRKYDKEFKLNALELYKNGKSGSQVCEDLGIPQATFWGWLADYKKDGDKSFPGSGNVKASNEEVVQLQKELADVKMERDILKKALAIFSRAK
jgi:transposase-like protein